ncbi:Retrovirus-related Pol polyprotein from transposon 412, partial [Frankliniella fusca]
MNLLLSAGLTARKSQRYKFIRVANQGVSPIEGEVSVPFMVAGKMKIVDVLYVPLLSSDLILGIDFWRRYHLCPDFLKGTCDVGSVRVLDPEEVEPPPDEDDVLSPEQRLELEDILKKYRPLLDTDELGCLKGVEHHIDTGDAPPCKQKYSSLNPKLLPLRSAAAKPIISHLKNDIFLVHGAPRVLVADNGQQYRGEEMARLCDEFKIERRFNLPYNPRSNPTERTNQTLGAMLRAYSHQNQKKWDDRLPELQHALRSAVSTVTGFSPHFLVFGRDVPVDGRLRLLNPQEDLDCEEPFDYSTCFKRLEILRADVLQRLSDAKRKNAARYNLRRRPDPFKPGDVVKLVNFVKSDKGKGFSKKLAQKYRAPFTIVRREGEVAYVVKTEDVTGEPQSTADLSISLALTASCHLSAAPRQSTRVEDFKKFYPSCVIKPA